MLLPTRCLPAAYPLTIANLCHDLGCHVPVYGFGHVIPGRDDVPMPNDLDKLLSRIDSLETDTFPWTDAWTWTVRPVDEDTYWDAPEPEDLPEPDWDAVLDRIRDGHFVDTDAYRQLALEMGLTCDYLRPRAEFYPLRRIYPIS